MALDIGNVCIRITPDKYAEALNFSASVGITKALIESVDKMERGLISEQEWMEDLHRITENKFSEKQLRCAFDQILGEEIDGIEEFLRQKTVEGYRIVFFSDTSKVHLDSIYRNLSFIDLISDGIFSFKANAKKPEAKMYEEFEKVHGKPDIYLDDKPENIEVARKRGWNSYVFTNIDNLIKDIKNIAG